jgi:hypothetical protein
MAADPEYPNPGTAAAAADREPAARLAFERGDEAGAPSALPRIVILPTDVSQPAADRSAGGGLAAMRARFLDDFAAESRARQRPARRAGSGGGSDDR